MEFWYIQEQQYVVIFQNILCMRTTQLSIQNIKFWIISQQMT